MAASTDVLLPPPVPTKFENISTVHARVKAAKTPVLPPRYVFPPSETVETGSIDVIANATLPVIDFANFDSKDPGSREVIANQIGDAASEWGFFLIVNHGCPEWPPKHLYDQARDFFQLPVDVKERAASDEFAVSKGYDGRQLYKPHQTPWLESLSQTYRPSPDVEDLAGKIWPGGNATFW